MKHLHDRVRSLVLLLWVGGALGFFSGCGVFSFDIDRDIREQRVEGSPLGSTPLGSLLDVPVPLDVDLEEEVAARDAGPVKKVYLSNLSLAITSTEQPAGDDDNFDFLSSVQLFVRSTKSDTALPEVLIGELSMVPRGAKQLDFEMTEVNIKPYVEEGTEIRSEVSGQVPPDDVSFTGAFTITVDIF